MIYEQALTRKDSCWFGDAGWGLGGHSTSATGCNHVSSSNYCFLKSHKSAKVIKQVRHQRCLWRRGSDSDKCDLWRHLDLLWPVKHGLHNGRGEGELTFKKFLFQTLGFFIQFEMMPGKNLLSWSWKYHFKLSIQIFNATEELELSAGYNDIRFTVLKKVTSDVEEQDIEPQVCNHPLLLLLLNMSTALLQKVAWADPSDSTSLRHMSAVCFLFARNLYDNMLERSSQ